MPADLNFGESNSDDATANQPLVDNKSALGAMAVRRSEEQLRLLMDATGEGIYSLDLEGKCQWCNSAAARMFGHLSPADLIGRNIHKLTHHTRANGEAYPEEDCAMMQAACEGRSITLADELLWRKDGSSFHAEYRSYPILREGAPAGVVVNFHDIERQRDTEQALRESESRMRALADSGIMGLSVNTPDGHVLEANDAFLAMTGYSRADLVAGQVRWDSDTAPEYRHHASTAGRLIRAGKPVAPWYAEMFRKDGSRVPVLLALAPAKEGAIRLMLDMSELRSTQQSLAAAEKRYLQLFERNLAGVFSVTTAGEILEANAAFARLAGYANGADLVSTSAPEIFPGLETLVEELRGAAGIVINRELDLLRPDGKPAAVLANINLLPADEEMPERLEGTVVDLTEYKVLEREFQQAQKMEGIGLLAGGVAHDFNNLLTVINGYSEMLLQKDGLDAGQRRRLEAIGTAGARAAALTRQLMAFSRRQTFELSVLDLNQVLSNATGLLQHMIGEHYQLELQLDPGLPKIKADATQIEQVIMNLVINARDAMPDGGAIALETGLVTLDADYAHTHREVRPGSYVMFAVTDSGTGMDEATRSRIFEPFFTTKELGRGTGLGLATVFGIVKQSGGTISVYSEPGHGTSMKIYLPAVEEAEATAEGETEADSTSGQETILLVEDEAAVREYVEEVLKGQGYRVLTADGAEAALGLSRNTAGPIHLLVTDIVMHGEGGPELAERLLLEQPELRVLFVSGYPSHALENRRKMPPGAAFLQKPYTAQAIGAKIRAVLDAAPQNEAAHA